MIHAVKIEPEYLEKKLAGKKPFEIRINDRDYKVGDYLACNVYENGKYTGRFVLEKIISIEEYPECLKENYLVLITQPCQIEAIDCYIYYGRVDNE